MAMFSGMRLAIRPDRASNPTSTGTSLPDGTIVWSDSMSYAIKSPTPEDRSAMWWDAPSHRNRSPRAFRQQTIERSLAEMEEKPDDPRVAEAQEMPVVRGP